jgi:hypothetical protein
MLPLEFTSSNPKRIATDAAGFKIRKQSARDYELKLWGRLPPDWLGSLSAGLCQTGISIVSGNAKKEQGAWQAKFKFTANSGTTDVTRIDYLSLAMDNLGGGRVADIFLEDFVLDADLEKHDGALYLEVGARDQLGFLGAVINRCAFYALFPETMVIDTVDGKVRDRFWIKGLGGQTPSDRAGQLLRHNLGSCLKKR